MKTDFQTFRRVENPPRFSEHTAQTIGNLAERSLRKTGGFSLSIPKLENPPSFGYLASVRGMDWILPEGDCEASDIAEYVLQNPPKLGRYLGGWKDTDTGYVHLDHSEYFASLPVALKFAKDNCQLAIWDCAQACDIRLQDWIPDRAGKPIDGIQVWSLGDTYPIGISCKANASSGQWYVWNLRTGQVLRSFRFGPLCGFSDSASACKACHIFAEACAAILCS